MLTNKFATNRSVLRVLIYGWEKEELPELVFKFRSKSMGSFTDVVSKFSSDIHLLIVAADSIDAPTKSILSKGYYSEKDACYFVEGKSVKDELGLNGHTADGNVKNIMMYGFEDKLSPEIIPIFRQPANGDLVDVLTAPEFNYAAAVVLESRPIDEGHYPGSTKIGTGDDARLQIISDEMKAFLKEHALYVNGQGGFNYFICPFSVVQTLLHSKDAH